MNDMNLTGTIPTEIGHVTFLQRLLFDSSDFSGTLPSELALLTNLIAMFVLFFFVI